MSYDNTVSFLFTATDRVTRTVNNIKSSISGLTGSAAPGGVGGVAASFLGNLGSSAVLGGISLATQGIQRMTGAMNDAVSAQTAFITTASGLGNSLGVPMKESKALLETLQKDLSTVAAVLPGENKDYLAVLNMLSDTVATGFKGDIEGFKGAILDITKRTAALGSTIPGLSGEASGQTMEMLMNGNTLTSLKRLDLFQKNAPLKNALEREMKAANLEDKNWTRATLKQRIAVIQKALKATATDELFSEFQDTAESLMQGMKNAIFDMQTGVFGFMRRVGSREDRTVLDAFTEVLKRIRTLGSAGNRLARALGFSFDPMETLIDVMDGVNNFLGNIAYQLDISPPELAVSNVIGFIGEWVSGMFSKAVEGVKGLDSSFLGKGVDMIGHFVGNINWTTVGRLLGNTVWKMLIGLVRAIPNVAITVGKIAVGLVQIVSGFVIGVVEGIGQSLYNLFLKPIVDFFNRMRAWWDKLKSSMPNLGGVGNAVQAVANVVTNPVGAAINLGKKVLGIGDNKDKPLAPGQPPVNADKVNAANKVASPIKPVEPVKTVQKTASNNTQTNTIAGLTINAANAGTPQEIASVVIEELNRQLNFKVAQQLA
jgi:hypothetical protein